MVPPGAKGYWGNDAARGIMVYRHVTPPGSGHKNESTRPKKSLQI